MENLPAKPQITQEDIDIFMNGRDAQERIVNLEYHYRDNFMQVYYRDENDNKCVSNVPFYPFLWATKEACRKLCNGNKNEIRANLIRYHLSCTGLDTKSLDGQPVPEIDNGYTVLFKAEQPMSYSEFKQFFKTCGNPVWKRDSSKADTPETPEEKIRAKQYLEVTPKEQFLIATGKRFFKGYGDYNGCLRMIFDLETTGLDTRRDRIEQFGIWFNRQVNYRGKKMDFHRIYDVGGETEKEKDESELENIKNFLSIIRTFKPDIITAHNGEAFDWNIIMGACQRLGTTIEALSAPYFNGESIHKEERESILKLGGEIEYYRKTVVPGCIVTDSLHAVRRAQAMDSNMLEANLKYVTKYAEMVKANRVYVPGDKISEIYNDYEEKYAFDDKNGDWYIYEPSYDDCTDKKGIDSAPFHLYTKNKLLDGYELVTGHYIVQRYLLDDLYECDRVEHRFNTTNFLICKILPLPFEKCCTMGTAGQWKSLMLAWSYEHRLAVPMSCENRTFTGGLSRLLRTGYVSREVKFDYNSLYPSITLTWGIATRKDISGVMLKMLEYVLTKREEYKGLKKKAGKLVDAYENKLNEGVSLDETENKDYHQAMSDYAFNDAKQMQMKVLANSFFGSYGNQSVFNWGDLNCAERITCTGRQALRLMIGYFKKLQYAPVVGDSFTGDTPLFIKYERTGLIDIKPISEIMDKSKVEIDALGREYDYSKKDYKVLCRNGWVEPSYCYRHKTNKDVYEVTDGETRVEVTQDHSLFNSDKEKIKPSEITESTNLEYYDGKISPAKEINCSNEDESIENSAKDLAEGKTDRVNIKYLNADKRAKKIFYNMFMKYQRDDIIYSKTCFAGILYLKNE